MVKISVCVILCVCISAILCMSEDMQEVIDMLHNTCKGQTGVEEEVIKKAQQGDFAEDEKLQCYAKCIMAEMSTIDDDGIVDVEATVALMPEDIRPRMEPTIRKCGTKMGANPCDNALQTFKCYYENNKADYFLP